jgi:hypothetical protein
MASLQAIRDGLTAPETRRMSMKRQSIYYRKPVCAAILLASACAAFMLAAPIQAQTQSPAKPRASAGADASGTVIVPPVTDPGMSKQAPPMPDTPAVKPPPVNVDPEAIRKPQPKAGADTMTDKAKKGSSKQVPPDRSGAAEQPHNGKSDSPTSGPSSAKDQCKGPVELCRQDSAR